MDARAVRREVDAFIRAEGGDRSAADCFPAWYLKHTFGISPTAALQQSSDPAVIGSTKGDCGLDAFFLEQTDGRLKLFLIQSKFTDSINLIAKGFRDLERCLPRVAAVLNRAGSPDVENKVYVNLRRQLDQATIVPDFEFQVVHLSEQDPMIIRANSLKPIDELKEEFRTLFPDAKCEIKLVGPKELSHIDIVGPPIKDWFPLSLSATPLAVMFGGKQVMMYSGIGHLAEIVELYKLRRDDLFSKNVRYFLRSKRNTEKGPSGKISETLKTMCVAVNGESPDPELFAFYHNGVTIFARDVRQPDGNSTIQVREPFVLNGCQTIKTGYYFLVDAKLKGKIDPDCWKRVKVPLRIITTRDEDLIRKITVSNNRQNQISPAALRANDPVQIELADRFKRHGIFYQRQEGAFEELEETNPKAIESDYPNTNQGYVDIEDLSRSLAATAAEMDYAHSPGRIFEYDAAYDRCFGTKRLKSIVFLTFLQNVHDVLSTVLKKDLDLEAAATGPRPSKLTYYAMCLLLRYLAKNRNSQLVIEYGGAIAAPKYQLRGEIAKVLDNYHSGIKKELRDKFLTLEDSRAESLKAAFQRAESSLSLKSNIEPFEVFADVGNE